MEVEKRVAGAAEKIAHIAAYTVVATPMYRAEAAPQNEVENGYVRAFEHCAYLIRRQSRFHKLRTEITAKAVRSVVQVMRVVQKPGVDIRADRTKGDSDVGKWPCNHAASASASRDAIYYWGCPGNRDDFTEIAMGYSSTIARHAAIRPIKQRRGFDVVRIQGPVPVTG